jgi:glycosyltransferase involved in cell wall biosynthesis
LPALYSHARAFVSLSTYEGFGLPFAEAMGCGTPSIGFNTSAPPEVVGDAGIMVPFNDLASVNAAVVSIVKDNALRTRLSARALKRARLFSWRVTAQKIWQIVTA